MYLNKRLYIIIILIILCFIAGFKSVLTQLLLLGLVLAVAFDILLPPSLVVCSDGVR